MLTPAQIEALINEPIYGLDALTLLEDVEDFLDFSEANIDWQAKRGARKAEVECQAIEFDDPLDAVRYREHRLEGVNYRFNVSLTQRIRYSGLTAVITSIEWSLVVMQRRATFAIPPKPRGTSEAVHLLGAFASRVGQEVTDQIKLLILLVHVRNCVVHSAGRIETYDFADDLRQALSGHDGIKLSNSSYLGESIEICPGYLQKVIEQAKVWLPALETAMHQQGLLK